MKKILLSLILLFLPLISASEPITVAWDANPPEENVVLYRVGQCAQGSTTNCSTRGETTGTQLTLDIPLSASQCFRVLAVNQYGIMSDWSQEVCINPTRPSIVNRWRVLLYVPR